ncbi:glycosyltransferase [Streptomyces griseorubiginosus]|uniref:glycosyltransferase n=1 Tax=Streptomyces griseorubiginosus TaxID=67304 RepID=UPI001AD649C3|nr:glycosyltransferase [Streptomyces griseorubiginosus]MBO4260319.1 glycosyltransferase [Streptomyces griseorubiginosus]
MHLPAPDPRPRVLHITQPVDGGVARVVTDLTRAQLAAGLHVSVACPASRLADELRALGADVHPWRAARSPGPTLVREVRRLVRVLAKARPDLVHAHSAKAGLAGRLAVRGRVPTVFQPHAWSFEAVDGGMAALALRWERWGARWASRVVCVSEAERATGARAGIAARWAVVPNGIDPGRFHPAAVDTVRAALLPDVDAAAPLVVCVGRLCRQKGQDVLLDAWYAVQDRVPEARLVLVGDGPDHDELRSRAPGSVVFAGAVPDAAPWYQAADLVVLPSRWEGMALAPLEAMACGRPVVLTDVDGARESLPPALRPARRSLRNPGNRNPVSAPGRPGPGAGSRFPAAASAAGRHGAPATDAGNPAAVPTPRCLVPPGDPGELADAVSSLLLDPLLRESLGHLGRRHVLSTHDVRHAAEAVAGVYRDLLGDVSAAAGLPSEYRESIHS